MNDFTTLRAAAEAPHGIVKVSSLDLAELLAEVDTLRAAAPAKKPRAKKAAPAAGAAEPLPAWLPLDAWAAFLDMRKKIKKPATEYAQKLLLKKLTAFYDNDLDPGVILNQSIVSGWQDLYAPKEPTTAARSSGYAPRLPVTDVNRANSDEAMRLLSRPKFDPDDGMTIEAAR